MLDFAANIIGIVTGVAGLIIAILSYMQNERKQNSFKSITNISVTNIYQPLPQTRSHPFLDEYTVATLWIVGFLICLYIYKEYRYWLMPVASFLVLLDTLAVYFILRLNHLKRHLPKTTLFAYLVTVLFTALTITCVAIITQPRYSSISVFHAFQIASIALSTLSLSIMSAKMISYAYGKYVNLNRLNTAAICPVITFLLASDLLMTLQAFFIPEL